jgi:hypothetical protein
MEFHRRFLAEVLATRGRLQRGSRAGFPLARRILNRSPEKARAEKHSRTADCHVSGAIAAVVVFSTQGSLVGVRAPLIIIAPTVLALVALAAFLQYRPQVLVG